MVNYQKLYTMLFNAAADALEALEELNVGRVNTPPENRRSDRRSPTARPQKSYTPAVGQTPCV